MAGKRSIRLALGVGVAVVVAVLFVLGLLFTLRGLMALKPPLNTLTVQGSDGPAGFAADVADSGLLTREQLQSSGLSAEMADLATGYRQVWQNDASGQTVQLIAYDFGAASRVAHFFPEFRDKATQIGLSVDEIPGVAGSIRAIGLVETGADEVFANIQAFGRGPLLFVITAEGPDQSVSTAATSLLTREVALVDSRYAGQTLVQDNRGDVIGRIAGGLIGYLLLLEIWAWLRDPMRRKAGSTAWTPALVGTGDLVSVDERARGLRLRAAGRSLVQLVGLVLIGSSLLPSSATTRVLFVIAGCLLWGGVSLAHRVRPRGWRKAIVWNAASVISLSAGVACVVMGATEYDSTGSFTVGSALLLSAAGISHRWGRRVSSRAAQDAMAEDHRPMVLFLRSFGDDRRRLRSATLGRRSLIEKLTPGRFDSFEEVLVRHLGRFGPVVAINPPGTSLAPLGAARATMPAEGWQSQVEEWLKVARLIVIAAPPQQVTEGLMWELGRLAEWDKVAVVVLPTPDDETRRRWRELTSHIGQGSPFRTPLPIDPALALVLRYDVNHWRVASATKRTEWTYAAALEAMVPRLRVSTPAEN